MTHQVGSIPWLRDFTTIVNNNGYPSMTPIKVAIKYKEIRDGKYDSLDPIQVLINNAINRENKAKAHHETV